MFCTFEHFVEILGKVSIDPSHNPMIQKDPIQSMIFKKLHYNLQKENNVRGPYNFERCG